MGAEPVEPARKKPAAAKKSTSDVRVAVPAAAQIAAKKSTSDVKVAQPAKPAKRKLAEGAPSGIKKIHVDDASAKPVRPTKTTSKQRAAAERKKDISKKVPSKEKIKFVSDFNSSVSFWNNLNIGCLFLFNF